MAVRVHVYQDDKKAKYYMISGSPNHKVSPRVTWIGVSGQIPDTKNLTLEGLGNLKLDTDIPEDSSNPKKEDTKETKKPKVSISLPLRRLAKYIKMAENARVAVETKG